MDTPVLQTQTAANQPDVKPSRTGAEYVDSLRNRKLKVNRPSRSYLDSARQIGALLDAAGELDASARSDLSSSVACCASSRMVRAVCFASSIIMMCGSRAQRFPS